LKLMDIETPAALIDQRRMAGNIARMQDHLSARGVRLRPHVKTSKCIEVARAQQEAGAAGITVSTLKEAEQFFAAGFTDVLYAVCIAPDKLDRALALIAKGCALTLLVDSVAAAEAVVAKGKAANQTFNVMIEIDSDGHRSGVQPEAPELIEIGRVLQAGGATVKGVLTHAGSSYDLDTPEALQALAEQERALCVRGRRAPARGGHRLSGGQHRFDADGDRRAESRRRHRGAGRRLRLLRSRDVQCRRLQARERRALGADHGDRPSAREGLGDRRCRLDGDESGPRHSAPEDRLWLWRRVRRRRKRDRRLDRLGRQPGARHRLAPRRRG
jgi:D-serine deaminase-like pyridoxal phosphate-dependent protein